MYYWTSNLVQEVKKITKI